ncbi:MAG TPA: hypothetical protein DCZ55_17460 [Cyanobacteria bacterium UBA11371]|nr:hypothetical protein [Cyanobacteria bacterium UBA11371]
MTEARHQNLILGTSDIMSGGIGIASGRGGFNDICKWFRRLTGKTRPYNIKNYTQPMLQDTI